MSQYYQIYQQLDTEYTAYVAFVALLQEGPVNVKVMELFFQPNLYLDTQPVIFPKQTIDMYFNDGTTLYSDPELLDIQNIYNFFGGSAYSMGRKFKEFCLYYKTRFSEDLITVIEDIKTAYSF